MAMESIDALLLGAPDDPLVTVRPEPIKLTGTRESREEVSSKLHGALEDLLGFTPKVFSSVAQAGAAATTYAVRFAPHVMEGLSEGSLGFKKAAEGGWLAVAEDPSSHQVVGLPRKVPDVKVVAAIGAVWTALSVITAQRFLAEIHRELQLIRERLDDIKDWQRSETEGAIVGDMKYLSQLESAFREADYSEQRAATDRHQLESIERSVLQRIEHLRSQRERAREKLRTQTWRTGFFSSRLRKNREEALRNLREYDRLARLERYNLLLRAALLHCRAALGLGRATVLQTAEEISLLVAENERSLAAFNAEMEDRIPWLRSLMRTDESDRFSQEEVRAALRSTVEGLRSADSQVLSSLKQLARSIDAITTLHATVDVNGKVLKASRILSLPAGGT